MNASAIIVFVRRPQLGMVKTRLAKTVGDQKALNIYRLLLEHTRNITENLPSDKYIFFDSNDPDDEYWHNNTFFKRKQVGEDLGERMQHAFSELFTAGHERVMIIGSDCYELTSGAVEEAFGKLQSATVVIGPARDGGYYLLGLQKLIPDIFQGIAWSTGDVFQQTVTILQSNKVGYEILPVLSDIDTEADIPETLKIKAGIADRMPLPPDTR